MAFYNDYSLTATGLSLPASTTNTDCSESSLFTSRLPHNFSRLLRIMLSTSANSDSNGTSTEEAEYDIFQDDRFKPGLFFPHRAGPIVTFDEKVTIFYCKEDGKLADEAGTVAQGITYVKEEGSLSDSEGRSGKRQGLALPYKELYCIAPLPSGDEEENL